MKLHPTDKKIFWAAAILMAASLLVYTAHLVAQFIIHVQILHLQLIAFGLVSAAFLLLFLGMLTIPGRPLAVKTAPRQEPDQGPIPAAEKQTVSPLVEAEKQPPDPSVEISRQNHSPFSGKIKYYLIIAILCVVLIGMGYSPWADYQSPFSLFVGLPAGFWLIYKLSEEEKPGE